MCVRVYRVCVCTCTLAATAMPLILLLPPPLLAQHDEPIQSVHWLGVWGLVVTGGWDSVMKIWDPRARACTHTIPLAGRVWASDFKQDLLVVATSDNDVSLYMPQTLPTKPDLVWTPTPLVS